MIRSMTGFGQAKLSAGGYTVFIDVKSVNHRYCEVSVRLPKDWAMFEEPMRKLTTSFVKRGRIDLFVTIERAAGSAKSVSVNWDLADGFMQASEQLKQRYNIANSVSLTDVLHLPGIMEMKEERDEQVAEMEETLITCLREALQSLLFMREREGQFLTRDLEDRLSRLENMHQEGSSFAPHVVTEYAVKLRQRVQDLVGDAGLVDESRLATEIALFADRCSIEEELTRLSCHFEHFRSLLQSAEPIGRKLDFLIQEMNREVNTIGSKANHAELAEKVINMKAELEKMREQIQNIE
ncbi:YicC family protein [Paenibacillus sp. N1-5-1-14]|uniref:YicC/YloC family endoribonuclease n=1 Tax=Paenibacillus radicibacter TaxID=2972488 RepID=UPI002158B211|nr:YicC/YloC family endoribonuclease [Paenibacillus radicibacter]MCR8641719.1 YicC family protein [Paenibacillus radicibacter]